MYSVTVRRYMMVAHSLPSPAFGPAQGLHGATLVVEATVRRGELGPDSIVLDIGAAGDALDAVLEPLRYRNLDDLPQFAGRLSTTEVVAHHVATAWADRLGEQGLLARCHEVEARLREHPDAWASYTLALATDPPD